MDWSNSAYSLPGSIYGNDVIIDLVVSKYFELIPTGRLAKISLMAGFDFKPNSMIECTLNKNDHIS